MKYLKYAIIIILAGVFFISAQTMAATSVDLNVSQSSLKAGDTFTLNIGITPDPQINSAKLKIIFNADVLEMKSFSFASGWMPVTASGYDAMDNLGGTFTKTGGYPGGLTSKGSFGTATFVAKKDGSASFELSPESQILSPDNKNELPLVLPKTEIIIEPLKPIEPKPVEKPIEPRPVDRSSDAKVSTAISGTDTTASANQLAPSAISNTESAEADQARAREEALAVTNANKPEPTITTREDASVLGIKISEPVRQVMEDRFVSKLTKTADISFDAKTVKANALYVIIIVLLFTFLATLTNQIFKSFSDDFDRFFRKYFPKRSLARHEKKTREWFHRLMVLGFLVVYSFVTIFLEQPESMREGIVVFLVTFIAISIFVVIKESTQKILLKRKNVETRFSYYIFGIIILAVSVIISRYFEISPPLLVGIPVVLIYLAKNRLAEKEEQKISTISSVVTFVALLIVWFSTNFNNPAWQSAALLLFTLGIEDMFFTMIPLKDFPGQQVLKYSKILWVFLFAFVAITFTFTIINPDGGVNDAYNTPISQTFMWILGVYTVVTIVVYFIARYLDKKQHERLGDEY